MPHTQIVVAFDMKATIVEMRHGKETKRISIGSFLQDGIVMVDRSTLMLVN
jgi:hypothetical protein